MQHLPTWQLFAVCVAAWSTTWYAITWQIAAAPPAVGVGWRFSLAAACVLGWCAWRRSRLRASARQHGWLMLQGALMFSFSYICVYQAERHVPSGLVAVGYSASPLVNGLGARWLFGMPFTARFVAGGVVGVAGVVLIFLPEVRAARLAEATLLGAGFTVAAVLLSSMGNLAAKRNQDDGLPFWPTLGWSMGYGAALSLGFAAFEAWSQGTGSPSLLPPAAASWWLALVYLALVGSVLTFACYLTLLERVGPGRTSTIGVMTPLLALIVSVFLEGYRADVWTAAGAALAVLGNALMLGWGRADRPPQAGPSPPAIRSGASRATE